MITHINILHYGDICKSLQISLPFMRGYRINSDAIIDVWDVPQTHFDKSRLLCLIGDNECGKTAILSALINLHIIVTKGAKDTFEYPYSYLFNIEKPFSISVEFIAKYKKFTYSIYSKGGVILEERLSYKPKVKSALLFRRKVDEYGNTELAFGESLKMTPSEKTALKSMLSREKTLLFTYSKMAFRKPTLDAAWHYLSQQFCAFPHSITAKHFCKIYPMVTEMLNCFSVHIKDFNNNQLESLKSIATTCKDSSSGNIEFQQALGRYLRTLSSGMSEFIEDLIVIAMAIINDGVCIIDDFADKMDVEKAYFLLDFFLGKKGSSQLIISTHRTTLLDYEHLRREYVVFMYRNADGFISADQKLAKSLQKTVSLANAYNRGIRPSSKQTNKQ